MSETTTHLVRTASAEHDTFTRLDRLSTDADVAVMLLAKNWVESHLPEDFEYVEFGWEEACDGPEVISYRTVDGWDLDAKGFNRDAGIAYEDDSFEDIDDAIGVIDAPGYVGIEETAGMANLNMRFRIYRVDGMLPYPYAAFDAAIEEAVAARTRTEVAAVAALKARLPLTLTSAVLHQCLVHMFFTFSSARNAEGPVYDDDVMNELDQYAEAIRYYHPSQAAQDAGLKPIGDGYWEVRRAGR